MWAEGCQAAMCPFRRDDHPGSWILVAGGRRCFSERFLVAVLYWVPCCRIPAFFYQYSSQHDDTEQGGKKQAQQGGQSPEHWFSGDDPDCIRIGRCCTPNVWQHYPSCHMRSWFHNYSYPFIDKPTRQIHMIILRIRKTSIIHSVDLLVWSATALFFCYRFLCSRGILLLLPEYGK